MGVNAYEFPFSLHICDNIVDRNLCCGTCCGRYSDDRYAGFPGRSYAFQASYILKLRVCDNDTDGFGGIHGRTAADGNEIISAEIFECLNAVLYILDGRVGFDIGIQLIFQSVFLQDIRNLACYMKFYQIWIRANESFFKAVSLCFIAISSVRQLRDKRSDLS